MMTSQDRQKMILEMQELRDHIELKDHKINVQQRKVEWNSIKNIFVTLFTFRSKILKSFLKKKIIKWIWLEFD